jgi:hypothetical protein
MGMRRPLRMVGSIFAAFDCRALPRLIAVRELYRAFRSGISLVGESRCEPPDCPALRGSYPGGIPPQFIGLSLVA